MCRTCSSAHQTIAAVTYTRSIAHMSLHPTFPECVRQDHHFVAEFCISVGDQLKDALGRRPARPPVRQKDDRLTCKQRSGSLIVKRISFSCYE